MRQTERGKERKGSWHPAAVLSLACLDKITVLRLSDRTNECAAGRRPGTARTREEAEDDICDEE